jgi:hypothetical protein
MTCDELDEVFNQLSRGLAVDEDAAIEHLASCKSCHGKYTPISGLLGSVQPTPRPKPIPSSGSQAFYLFLAVLIGIAGLTIFLFFVR